jgi:hypothetical protein
VVGGSLPRLRVRSTKLEPGRVLIAGVDTGFEAWRARHDQHSG